MSPEASIHMFPRGYTKHYFAGAEKECVAQPIQYLPFGEEYVSEHTASPYSERFTFTGKEWDEETGYTYHGARYYGASLMCSWFSVDPLSDKYPSLSPYNYCAWNPVKLVDPDGMEIKNSYQEYQDISSDLEYFHQQIVDDPEHKEEYEKQIHYLESCQEAYYETQKAINAFKEANPEEYKVIDNLTFKGKAVDVYVGVDLSKRLSDGGALAETRPKFLVDQGEVVGFHNEANNYITVTLFKNAFIGGKNGLGAIANEFGDVLFAVLRPDYACKQAITFLNNEHGYEEDPAANFSYDNEFYICHPKLNKKPNPYDY